MLRAGRWSAVGRLYRVERAVTSLQAFGGRALLSRVHRHVHNPWLQALHLRIG